MSCRSRYQLTYQQAQDMVDEKPPTTGPRDMPVHPRDHAELRSRLTVFKCLTDQLRAARVKVKQLPEASCSWAVRNIVT